MTIRIVNLLLFVVLLGGLTMLTLKWSMVARAQLSIVSVAVDPDLLVADETERELRGKR